MWRLLLMPLVLTDVVDATDAEPCAQMVKKDGIPSDWCDKPYACNVYDAQSDECPSRFPACETAGKKSSESF